VGNFSPQKGIHCPEFAPVFTREITVRATMRAHRMGQRAEAAKASGPGSRKKRCTKGNSGGFSFSRRNFSLFCPEFSVHPNGRGIERKKAPRMQLQLHPGKSIS